MRLLIVPAFYMLHYIAHTSHTNINFSQSGIALIEVIHSALKYLVQTLIGILLR